MIDTVWVSDNIVHLNTTVKLVQKIYISDILYGVVTSNESTYSVAIPDKTAPHYDKVYHVTLQSDSKLTLDSYETDATVPGDSVVNHCIFVGTKLP